MRKLEKFTPLPIPEEEQTDKISVIVAVYNIEAYLENVSVPSEIRPIGICRSFWWMHGATDGCPAICDRLAEEDGRIQVIHKKNGGSQTPGMPEPLLRTENISLL